MLDKINSMLSRGRI